MNRIPCRFSHLGITVWLSFPRLGTVRIYGGPSSAMYIDRTRTQAAEMLRSFRDAPAKYPHTHAQLDRLQWQEITESRYYDLMNAVPPKVYAGPAFVVGEELCSLDDGTVVWTTCAAVDGRYFTKPNTLARFRASDHAAEIRKQIKETVEL